MVLSTVRESGWSVPLAMAEEDMETTSESDLDDSPPVHPVPTMQGAFEESMAETMNGDDEGEPPDRFSKADSVTRRKLLLEQDQYERTVAGRWKQKPGEKFHPLWKLVAQISFGMHLLQQGLAKSDEEVLKILQTHVDEVDGFLERTTEDFDLAQADIDERIRYLKLPLEHRQVFDQMLTDRSFRVAIVEGNEKIEHIIDRTAAAMNDALKDVQKGLDATRELAKYMTRVDKMWEDRTEEHDSVYLAMIGNTEGWTRAFLTLQSKGSHLRKALVQLGSIVAEMQRRAGAASRKNLTSSRSGASRYAIESRSKSPQQKATPPRSPNKPLPTAPEGVTRIATSQKYTKTSVTRSGKNSPYQNQSAAFLSKPASKDEGSYPPRSPETKMFPRNRNVSWFPRSPDPSGVVPNSSPEQIARPYEQRNGSISPKMGLAINSIMKSDGGGRLKSQELIRSTNSPQLSRKMKSPEPIREDGPEYMAMSKTPTQIMARAADTSKSAMPERPPSRRRSLTERTRSFLGKRQSSPTRADEHAENVAETANGHGTMQSNTDLPIQSPVEELEAKNPPSLEHLHNQQMSMPAYPSNPASQMRLREPSPPQDASPQYHEDGKSVPAQSSSGSLSLLPKPPEFSPLQNSFLTADLDKITDSAMKANTPKNSETPAKLPPASTLASLKPINVLDDSEGDVNVAHPLLREERHARFATRTRPGSPGIKSLSGRPLRHYYSESNFAYSNPDLPQRQLDGSKTLKRSSSLFYRPEFHSTQQISVKPGENDENRPPSHQTTPNASVLNIPRANDLPPETDLGVHPAHRKIEPSLPNTRDPTPDLSESCSTTEQGATPPPISTGPTHHNSPPSRFAPMSASRPLSPNLPRSPQRNTNSRSPDVPKFDSQNESSDPKQTPFYLNPASPSALMDFLATTPPPTPPPGAPRETENTEPGSPQTGSTSGFFNRPFTPRNAEASPPPPTPGALPNASWSTGTNDRGNNNVNGVAFAPQRKFSNWKKVFGGTKIPKERKEKTGKKKITWGKDAIAEGLEESGHGKKEKEKEKDFIGVSQNGVWLSRSNFLRS